MFYSKSGLFLTQFVLIAWLFFLPTKSQAESSIVQLDFYSQPGCKTCNKIRNTILPELKDHFAGKVAIVEYDTSEKKNFIRLLETLERLKVNSNESAYIIVEQKEVLSGEQIEKKIFERIEFHLNPAKKNDYPQADFHPDNNILHKYAGALSVWTIILAGFIDGINPCVISTLIFFISLLAVAKVPGKRILLVGLVYCLACFTTYLLLGGGLLYFIKLITSLDAVRVVMNLIMIGILFVFGIVSLLDAIRFQRGQGKSGVWLRLPDSISSRIHRFMKIGVSYRVLLPGIFLVGVIVTLLESVCTGQVYLPVLVLMAKETTHLKWIVLLLLYNLMFILPLLLIFWIFYRGMNTMKLLEWAKHHVVTSKIVLALFFFVLALLLFYT